MVRHKDIVRQVFKSEGAESHRLSISHSVLFSETPKPWWAKTPSDDIPVSGSSQGRYAKLSGMTTGLSQQLCSRGLVALDG